MDLMTAKEIAAVVKLAPRYVAEKLTKRRDFPAAIRMGSVRRWERGDFERWLASRKGA